MKPKYNPNILYSNIYNRWEVESETIKGHRYTVYYDHSLNCFVCTCPWGKGLAIRKKQYCKHVKAVRRRLEALANE